MVVAELSASNTVAIKISLERLVSLAHTMACLVGRQLDEAVGQDNRSSCVEPEAGSGGGCFGEPPVRREGDEQASLVSSPEVGDIYSVGTDF